MKPLQLIEVTFVVALISAVAALAIPDNAWATHFRSGQIFWRSDNGTTIEFTVQDTFRRSFLPFTAYVCRDPVTLAVIPCSDPDGLPGVGDIILETIGDTVFLPGDGAQIGNPIAGCPTIFCLLYKVTAIDPDNQWLFGEALDPASLPDVDTTIEHTYSGLGDFLAFIDSGDRIEGFQPPNEHINNPEGGYRIETLVNVGTGNSSPVSALPPIVRCPINALCEFLVPGEDADEDPLNFRLSTSAEASSSSPFVQPGPPDAPNPASIDAMTGLYTWDTTGATLATDPNNSTLYSTQVTIEDLTSKIAVDFLIQLVEEDPEPPVIEPPAGSPPICETTQVVTVDTTKTFDVIGSDPEPGDIVTLNVVGLPEGSTMTPSLPVAGNPVSSTFSWTPDATQVGMFVINFSASSTGGGFALCPVAFDVVEEILLDIDIKFLSNPNGFNCKKKGGLPVLIFGMETLDVTDIDVSTLRLVRADGQPGEVGPPTLRKFDPYEDRGDPADKGVAIDGIDVFNPDGIADLSISFNSQQIVALIGCSGAEKGAILPDGGLVVTGALNDGTPIFSTAVPDVGIDQLLIQNK